MKLTPPLGFQQNAKLLRPPKLQQLIRLHHVINRFTKKEKKSTPKTSHFSKSVLMTKTLYYYCYLDKIITVINLSIHRDVVVDFVSLVLGNTLTDPRNVTNFLFLGFDECPDSRISKLLSESISV